MDHLVKRHSVPTMKDGDPSNSTVTVDQNQTIIATEEKPDGCPNNKVCTDVEKSTAGPPGTTQMTMELT